MAVELNKLTDLDLAEADQVFNEADATEEAAAEPNEDETSEAAAEPEEAPTETPTASAQTTVKLGDTEINVDPTVADAIRREIDARAGRYGSELDRMRRQIADLEARGAAPVEPIDEEPEVLPPNPELLDVSSDKYNPREYHAQSLAYNEALMVGVMQAQEQARQQETTESTEQYNRDAAWKGLWNNFYTKIAPELKDYGDVVNAVYQQNETAIRSAWDGDDEVKLRKLKGLVVERITRIAEAGKAFTAPTPPTLGSSRRGPVKSRPIVDDDEQGSMIDLDQHFRRAVQKRASVPREKA